MEKLTSPKTTYLLQAGVEVLHYETREWQRNIEFWQDEMLFLNRVADQFSGKITRGVHNIKNFREKLFHYRTVVLPQLFRECGEHEKLLAKYIETENTSDKEAYRQKHLELSRNIQSTEEELRRLKKDLYLYLEEFK
ncbi:MAG TPA: hypothetical protein VIK89_09640 [Cytophagaceae bacterium]